MKYEETLEKKYNELHNATAPWESLSAERACFTEFVEDFFSKDGEVSNIKTMYESLDHQLYTSDENKKAVINLEHAKDIYSEYLRGMVKFVQEVCSYDENTDVNVLEACEEPLNVAKEKDHMFIESIKDRSDLNPMVERSTKERFASVLPEMIDFTESMKEQERICNTLLEESGKDIPDGIKKESLRLLFESVSYYWLNSLKNMVTEYTDVYTECMDANENKEDESSFVLV